MRRQTEARNRHRHTHTSAHALESTRKIAHPECSHSAVQTLRGITAEKNGCEKLLETHIFAWKLPTVTNRCVLYAQIHSRHTHTHTTRNALHARDMWRTTQNACYAVSSRAASYLSVAHRRFRTAHSKSGANSGEKISHRDFSSALLRPPADLISWQTIIASFFDLIKMTMTPMTTKTTTTTTTAPIVVCVRASTRACDRRGCNKEKQASTNKHENSSFSTYRCQFMLYFVSYATIHGGMEVMNRELCSTAHMPTVPFDRHWR